MLVRPVGSFTRKKVKSWPELLLLSQPTGRMMAEFLYVVGGVSILLLVFAGLSYLVVGVLLGL
jgi:hypothetical protein